jgi:hypothetical protein
MCNIFASFLLLLHFLNFFVGIKNHYEVVYVLKEQLIVLLCGDETEYWSSCAGNNYNLHTSQLAYHGFLFSQTLNLITAQCTYLNL